MSSNDLQHSSAQVESVPSYDYRTLLLMKRNNARAAWRLSEDEDTDSDYSDDEDDKSQADATSLQTDKNENLTGQVSNSDESCSSSVSDYDVILDSSGAPQLKPKLLTTSDDHALLKISVLEQKLTKCLQVNINETVWATKQKVIQTLAKRLTDALNYGFYCKKLGIFLLDHKPLSEYVEAKSVAAYELRYKRRVYNEIFRSAQDSKQLLKMQGTNKRKNFIRYVQQYNVEKINLLIKKGVDPNFYSPSSGETPLTLAVENDPIGVTGVCSSSPIITALVAGGAHMDFRDQRGFTPLHVAVKSCNVNALKSLIDLGASADVVDSSDLTPLYHCGLIDDAVGCIKPLYDGGANLKCFNSQKWTILHQVCRYGRYSHLKVILDILDSSKDKKDILNAQNESGNTALHICAIYNQEKCLVTLLRNGVDTTTRNYAHQDAYEVAIVARNVNLASVIKDFPNLNEQEIALWMHRFDADQTNMTSTHEQCRRHTVTASTMTKTHRGFSLRRNPFGKEKHSSTKINKLSTSSTIAPHYTKPIHTSIQDIYPATGMDSRENSVDDDKISISSNDNSVVYIVCQDYQAATSDHLTVKTGDTVIVTSLDKSEVPVGFCKGTVGQSTGLIPLLCIQAVKLRNAQSIPNSDKESEKNSDILSEKSEENENSSIAFPPNDTMINEVSDVTLQATSHPDVFHRYRDVTLSKGSDGYGFVLRGAKSDGPIENFSATARHPGLQYLESVEVGSNAYRVGLRAGDYVLKINATDVTCMGHKQTVDVIRRIRDPIRLYVVSVVERPKESCSEDGNASVKSAASAVDLSTRLSKGPNPSSPRHALHRTGSIVSAIGKLDSVLAMEDSDDTSEEATATLRRRPISRRFRAQELQDVFARDGQKHRPQPGESQTCSAATGRRLIRVIPPALPKDTSVVADEIIQNGTSYPSNSLERNNTFSSHASTSPLPPTSSVTSHHAHNAGKSIQSDASASNKRPPPPPTRRTSRLTSSEEKRTLVAAQPPQIPAPPPPSFQVPQQPPPPVPQANNAPKLSPPSQHVPRLHSPTSPQSLGRGFLGGQGRGDMSGIAAAIAVQAQQRKERLSSGDTSDKVDSVSITHNLVSKPPPAVARKPDRKSDSHARVTTNGGSALSIALAAKQESLRQRSQTEPVIHHVSNTRPAASGQTHATNQTKEVIPKPTAEEMRELMQLPPPPPTPPTQQGVPYNLPPPPPPTSQPNHIPTSFDQMILPPPPDAMINCTIPPPAGFAAHNKPSSKLPTTTPPPSKYRDSQSTSTDRYNSTTPPNGVDSISNTDSGVDDIGLNSRHHNTEGKPNIETLSVVSSLSAVSSEEGSDAGVSLSYDPKNVSEPAPTGNMYLDALKKSKSHSSQQSHAEAKNPSNNITLTKVSFTSSKSNAEQPRATNPSSTSHTYVNHTPARVDVTKSSSNNLTTQDAAPKATAAVAASNNTQTKPLVEWNVDEVCKWLNDLGLGVHAQIFAENEIIGSHLPDLGKEDLQELGVTRVGHRLTIERSLKKLIEK